MRRILLALPPIALLGIGGLAFSNSLSGKLFAVVVRGRTQCPLGLTMSSMTSVKGIVDATARMKAGSRLLREDGDLQLWDTPRGQFWMPRGSAASMPLVLAEQEQQIYGKGAREVRPGDIVLDCGADVGTFTRTALAKGAQLVVSIDPGIGKDESLRRNFAREIADGRVIVLHKGVWDREDTLKLYGDSVVEKHAAEGVDVPLTTIDNIVAELKLPRVDYIKMDIEGAEKPALTGARATLTSFHPRLSIATEHLPDDAVAIPALIRSIASTYQTECGPCEWANGQIRPQVIYLF
jgi:FkbM family methyltransferase